MQLHSPFWLTLSRSLAHLPYWSDGTPFKYHQQGIHRAQGLFEWKGKCGTVYDGNLFLFIRHCAGRLTGLKQKISFEAQDRLPKHTVDPRIHTFSIADCPRTRTQGSV